MIMLASLAMLGGAAWSEAAPLASDATSLLPPGAGRDVMMRVCSGCHKPEIVAHLRMNHDAWKELVEEMASRGADASAADLTQTTEYLAGHFPAPNQSPATGEVLQAPRHSSKGED